MPAPETLGLSFDHSGGLWPGVDNNGNKYFILMTILLKLGQLAHYPRGVLKSPWGASFSLPSSPLFPDLPLSLILGDAKGSYSSLRKRVNQELTRNRISIYHEFS